MLMKQGKAAQQRQQASGSRTSTAAPSRDEAVAVSTSDPSPQLSGTASPAPETMPEDSPPGAHPGVPEESPPGAHPGVPYVEPLQPGHSYLTSLSLSSECRRALMEATRCSELHRPQHPYQKALCCIQKSKLHRSIGAGRSIGIESISPCRALAVVGRRPRCPRLRGHKNGWEAIGGEDGMEEGGRGGREDDGNR